MSNYNLNPELDERLRVSLANPGSFMEDLSLVYAFHQFPVLAPKSVFFVPIEDHKALPVFTTEEELESYYIVRAILSKYINVDRITYSDKESYFAIILDDHITKWLCRIYIKKNKKYIGIVENGEQIKYTIENISDIYGYADKLFARLQVLDVK